jgi:hypothetical protein
VRLTKPRTTGRTAAANERFARETLAKRIRPPPWTAPCRHSTVIQPVRPAESWGMAIRLIKDEAIRGSGSFEVLFDAGRPSVYFYFEDLPGRGLRPDPVDAEDSPGG